VTRYAALLRGVNVGGVNIKMTDLAETVRGLGWDDVRTVLASGNVLFETDADAASAKSTLESALRERFGYDAWVHVLPLADLKRVVDAYPFERGRDGWHDYVVIVADDDALTGLKEQADDLDPELERAEIAKGVVYWTVEKGRTLDSVMGKAQAKAKLKPWVTSRNVNTLDRLLV
jgi:uncharacterized protein (DUF1697 family)